MKNKHADSSLFRRILKQAQPYRFRIGGFFMLSLLATPLALLAPVPMKIVVDNVINQGPFPNWLEPLVPTSVQTTPAALLVFSIVFFLIITLLTTIHKLFTWNILYTRITEKMLLDFRSRLLNYAQRLSIGFHDSHGTSHASYRIHYDTYAVQNVVFDTIIPLTSSVLTFVAMLFIVFQLDLTLALIAIIAVPFIFLMTSLYRKPLRKGWTDYKNQDYAALSIVNEVLSMLRVIKAFGREEYEGKRFSSDTQTAIHTKMRVTWMDVSLSVLMTLTTTVGTVAVLYIGTLHVLDGSLTLGNLLLIMSYLAQLYSPLKTIGSKVAGLQAQLASAERAFDLLDHPNETEEKPNALPLEEARGAIRFEHVTFSYNKKDDVLKNINCDIPAGTRVGIAGKTGSGKSTLVSLLFRFYDPDSGRILLDGRDLKDYRLKDLRRQFSIVLQDSMLFSGTIAENIAYGTMDKVDMGDIIRAAEVANAHEFITRLPDGYNSQVGERGMKLSGGERQRIALARAFISDAPMLVLDEPTSSVDTRTESVIVHSMDKLMEGKTTFIIAHRLTTLESCDLLLVIDDGRIVNVTSRVKETVRQAVLDGGLEINAKGEILD